jgi:hypothetical protein
MDKTMFEFVFVGHRCFWIWTLIEFQVYPESAEEVIFLDALLGRRGRCGRWEEAQHLGHLHSSRSVQISFIV